MTFKELHRKAMKYNELAIIARRNNPSMVTTYTLKAYEFEKKALTLYCSKSNAEPTKTILIRSAANLAMLAGLFHEAKKLITMGLNGEPPKELEDELRAILHQIKFDISTETKKGVILIDDEQKSINELINLLEQHCPQVEILAQSLSTKEGIAAIKKHKPDLVILNIEISQGDNVFDMLINLKNIEFDVIFIASTNNYILKAFKFSGLDYLLKPIDALELKDAIQRFVKRKENLKNNQLSEILKVNIKDNSFQTIVLHTNNGLELIKVNNIIRFEASGSYTIVHTLNKDKILVKKSIKGFELLLSKFDFFRIHRSHLINLAHVKKYSKANVGSLIMVDNSIVIISSRHKNAFLKKFS